MPYRYECFLDNTEEYEDVYDRKDRLLRKADSMSTEDAIMTIRGIYLEPELRRFATEKGLEIADDPDCIRWFIDYWDYVRWNEHGNEASFQEMEFDSFVDTIGRPWFAIGYLLGGEHGIREEDLCRRLRELNLRHFGTRGKAR